MLEDVSLAKCEEAIKQVKSVMAVRINTNCQGEIEEIHILASAERHAKQIVRDIETILMAQFGLEVDHKKISVAQIGDPDVYPSESARPKLLGVTSQTMRTMGEVKVQLMLGEKVTEGVAQGPCSSRNQMRLFAEATLRALSPLIDDKCIFVPEDVAITQLATHNIAQVALTLITPAGEQSLVGCALVRNDYREAVVKATLQAVNRKLGYIEQFRL